MNTRLLPVKLTEEEIKVKGEELAKSIDDHTNLEKEKKSVLSDFTKRLKESSEFVRRTAKIVETGTEFRDVPVRKDFDPKKNICRIFREDTGDLVEARSMTAEEYQKELFGDEDGEILFENEISEENDR
jgi:hypothetical protein